MKTSSSEAALTKKITTLFKQQGAVVYVAAGGSFSNSWPDRWIGWRGFSIWIEFKVGRNKCTPLQQLTIREIKAANISAIVVRLRENQSGDIEDEKGQVIQSGVEWTKILEVAKQLGG